MTSIFDTAKDATGAGQLPEQVEGASIFSSAKDAESASQIPSTDTTGARVKNPGTEAFAAGAVESSMVGAGGLMGLKIGGAVSGGNPYAMAVGLVGGMGIGAVGGAGARNLLGLRTPDEMAPDQRVLAKSMYSLGGSAAIIPAPFVAARIGYEAVERGVGAFVNGVIKWAAANPKKAVMFETTGALSAAGGAGFAEKIAPGDWRVAMGAEFAAGALDPVNRAITTWNFANAAFTGAMKRYGRNAQEIKLGSQIVEGLQAAGKDPKLVLKVLEGANPYNLSVAQLTGDEFFVAMSRSLSKKSDPFARSQITKSDDAINAMTAQINILKQSGDPQHLQAIAEIRQAQFEKLMEKVLEAPMLKAKQAIADGVRKGLTDGDIGPISAAARKPLDAVNEAAEDAISEAYSLVKRDIPVKMTNTQAVIDDILSLSSKELEGEKIPAFLMEAIRNAGKTRASRMEFNPDTYELTSVPTGPAMSDSKSMIDYRSKLLALSRVIDPEKAPQAGFAKRLQGAVMDDLDEAFKDIGDDAYNNARALAKAHKEVFLRSFVGDVTAMGKKGERMDPAEILTRAFAGKAESADIRLKDLEEATRFMSSRGFGEDGAVELMLKGQEDAYRIITTASMRGGRINPDVMEEYIRKNGALMNRPPFTAVRDDLREAMKSENGLRRIEDFVKRRNKDIGKNSAFARISGTDPVKEASRILVSTDKQETQLIKMFNLAKKGGTDRRGVVTITPEEGVSSARASILNAAFNRAKSNNKVDLEAFRTLLFEPNVSGQKSVITIMREQGVIEPEHIEQLSGIFNALKNIKIAERQGSAIDVKEGLGEMGVVLGAKIVASKGASVLQQVSGQSGSSIIVHGAVAKAAEAVVSKIPAAKLDDLAIQLFNDPKMLAAVMRKETNAQARMLQVRRFHAWAQNALLIPIRESEILPVFTEEQEPEMFSQ